jgi:hypothetical protein
MTLSPKSIVFIRRLLVGIAIGITLAGVFVVEENWRGKRAWEQYLAESPAHRIAVEAPPVGRPRVPAERNFFAAPIFSVAITQRLEDLNAKELSEARLLNLSRTLSFDPTVAIEANRDRLAQHHLLAGAATTDAAADLLAALEPAKPLLDSIRTAAQERPEAWLPIVDPTKPEPFNLGTYFTLARLLAFRAKVEIAAGRPAEAFADLLATLRMGRIDEANSPTLVEVLVGEAIHQHAATVVRVGCERHVWTEPQLATLQHIWMRFKPLAAAVRTVNTNERAMALLVLDTKFKLEFNAVVPWCFRVIPGWADQNKVSVCRYYDALVATVDPAGEKLLPDRVAELKRREADAHNSHSIFRVAERLVARNTSAMMTNLAEDAATLQQAGAAIALERYYLDHGRYPESLTALAPEYLSTLAVNPADGVALVYERPSVASYRLATSTPGPKSPETWTIGIDSPASSSAAASDVASLEQARRQALREQSRKTDPKRASQ